MRFDMHCHTKEGSLDGKVPIEEYISILKEKGFHGMLISDHNSYDGYREWRDTIKGKSYQDFVVLKGIEYDTIDAGHILVIMPERFKVGILELRGLPVALLIEIVHRYGGILGPAHPCGERYLSFINTKKRRNKSSTMLKFDFLEVFNACESLESNAEAKYLAAKYHKAGFGGSDAHKRECIGLAYTELPDYIDRESTLINFIKRGGKTDCGGQYYRGTVKEKIGIWNNVLVQSFWVYNRFSGLVRKPSRRMALKHRGYVRRK